jgi:glycosyltransferase involved in cell wall biosynthesis
MDVAVIIPTYNRAALLPVALDSVLAQTAAARIEVAVIDDGSTDHTAEVIRPYLERCGEANAKVVIRYTQLNHQGVIVARNTGIAGTTAPLVAFLDSDDYWGETKLAQQLAALAKPQAVCAHTAFRYVDEAGAFKDQGPQRLDNPCVGRCTSALLDEDRVIFSSAILRRSVLEKIAKREGHGRYFDPRFTCGEDYDLLLRASLLGEFAYVPEALTFYRVHGGQTGMDNLRRVFGYHCRVQMDFTVRHGQELGVSAEDGRRRAAAFLRGRAEALFWQRQFATVRGLCALARELGVYDQAFADLEERTARPAWVYKLKDAVDRWRGK